MNAHTDPTPGQLLLPLPEPGHDARLTARITPGWQAQAACQTIPGDVFYPEPDQRGQQIEAAALATCNRCRVRSSCRATAVRDGESGVWGGTTEADRDRMLCALSAGASVDAVLIETIRPHTGHHDDAGEAA